MLRLDLGSVTMKERIHQNKLNFIHHLRSLETESLASEIYRGQVKYDFPGFVKECRALITLYDLPNIIDDETVYSKVNWKKLVKEAVRRKSENQIHEEVQTYSKLRNKYDSDVLETKNYIKEMNLRNSRTMFRTRSSMLKNVKLNQKSNPKYAAALWKCDDCMSLDSQSHIIWCPAYAPLREGKNLYDDMDLVTYFQQVLKIREDMAKK